MIADSTIPRKASWVAILICAIAGGSAWAGPCASVHREYEAALAEYKELISSMIVKMIEPEAEDTLLQEAIATRSRVQASSLVSKMEQVRFQSKQADCVVEMEDVDPDPQEQIRRIGLRIALKESDPFPSDLQIEFPIKPEDVDPFDHRELEDFLEKLKDLEGLKKNAARKPKKVRAQLRVLNFVSKNELPLSYGHEELTRIADSKTIRVIPPWIRYLADSAISEGEPAEMQRVLGVVKRFQKLFPRDVTLVLTEARLQAELGDRDTALEIVRDVVKRNPEDPQARKALMNRLIRVGEVDEAIDWARQQADLSPAQQLAFFLLSRDRSFLRSQNPAEFQRLVQRTVGGGGKV